MLSVSIILIFLSNLYITLRLRLILSTKLVNLIKNPTKSNYTEILETIGMSKIPINSYEIKKQSRLSSDVYRIIAELCPTLHMKDRLLLNIRDMQKSVDD